MIVVSIGLLFRVARSLMKGGGKMPEVWTQDILEAIQDAQEDN